MTTTSLLPPGPEDTWLDITRPGMLVVRRFIEDEEPEWRELDYQIRVGTHGWKNKGCRQSYIPAGGKTSSFLLFISKTI